MVCTALSLLGLVPNWNARTSPFTQVPTPLLGKQPLMIPRPAKQPRKEPLARTWLRSRPLQAGIPTETRRPDRNHISKSPSSEPGAVPFIRCLTLFASEL
jgi:hypothetical protein